MYGKYKRERKKITNKLSNQIKIYKNIFTYRYGVGTIHIQNK